jgi:CheY-like chemotaxis protein
MATSRLVLVVSTNAAQRTRVVDWLAASGHEVIAADTFDRARGQIDRHRPDLLIADIKLEAYNGLHLAIWMQSRGLRSRTILIGEPDSVLQQEAERASAVFLSPPLFAPDFVQIVKATLDACASARQSPRRPVSLDGDISGVPVRIVDVSYGGVGLELVLSPGSALPMYFTLRLAPGELACRFRRVWARIDVEGQLACGAAVPTVDSHAGLAWRAILDALDDPQPGTASGGATLRVS